MPYINPDGVLRAVHMRCAFVHKRLIMAFWGPLTKGTEFPGLCLCTVTRKSVGKGACGVCAGVRERKTYCPLRGLSRPPPGGGGG